LNYAGYDVMFEALYDKFFKLHEELENVEKL